MKQFIIDTALITILWIIFLITLWKIVGYGKRLLVHISRPKQYRPSTARPLNKSKLKVVEECSKIGLVISLFLMSVLFIQATFNYQIGYFINLCGLIGNHKIIAIAIAYVIYSLIGRINKIRKRSDHTFYCNGKVYKIDNGRIKGLK